MWGTLEQIGLYVSIDKKFLQPGDDIWDQIEYAIKECDVVLLLLSRASRGSQNVGRELAETAKQGKDVAVLSLELSELPTSLRMYSRLWFTGYYGNGHSVSVLVESLKARSTIKQQEWVADVGRQADQEYQRVIKQIPRRVIWVLLITLMVYPFAFIFLDIMLLGIHSAIGLDVGCVLWIASLILLPSLYVFCAVLYASSRSQSYIRRAYDQ